MKIQRLTTGDVGLDLVLGGGIATLSRAADLGASAAVLIRGGPGAGKTVLGTQLALVLADQRSADVAYACVELLPTELEAQLESIWSSVGKGPRRVSRLLARATADGIQIPPFSASATTTGAQLFASTLQLPADGELEAMGGAIEELLAAIEDAGGEPSVLVVDSLARGYRLADAPRDFADALVKMAVARGLVLILLEEGVAGGFTEWAYAMDTVVELEHVDRSATAAAQLERRLWVTKNRFGPSTPGPHRFSVLQGDGVRVFPSEVTYATPWAASVGRNWKVIERAPCWGLEEIDQAANDEARHAPASAVAFVHGAKADLVRAAAIRLLPAPGDRDLWVVFGQRANIDQLPTTQQHDWVVALGNPMLSPQRLLSVVVGALDSMAEVGVGRVLIGDLAALELYYEPDALRRSLAVLMSVLDRTAIPVVLFETSRLPSAQLTPPGESISFAGLGARPKLMDWADAAAEVIPMRLGQSRLRFAHRASAWSMEIELTREKLESS